MFTEETDYVKATIDNLDGWFSKEGIAMHNFAKNCTGRGVIVEIGSWIQGIFPYKRELFCLINWKKLRKDPCVMRQNPVHSHRNCS